MNSTSRRIKEIIEPEMVIEGAGVLLRRSFSPARTNHFDPFLLFDHFAFNDPIEDPPAGFPTHPHRGIETVTYMLEGNVRHRDSIGNMGIIGPGDVQWMTSGRGIMHEEMPQRGLNGIINGFQLWVNLPSQLKMSAPRYQEITSESIPMIEKDGARVRVIAGEYGKVFGPATEIAAQPLYLDVTLGLNMDFQIRVVNGHTAIAYVFEGSGLFGAQGKLIEAVKMLVFSAGDRIDIRGGEMVSDLC
jgi:redox-sensitive bicupin YhaK (pirin superfamily)